MSEDASVTPLTFGPPERVADDVSPTADTPPRRSYTCEVCLAPLIYNGRGRPPTRCAEHQRTKSTGSKARTTPARKTRAESEAQELADKLNVRLTQGVMMVAALSLPDAKAILAAKPSIVSNYRGVMATHDNWRKSAMDVQSSGTVAGLAAALLLAGMPILANHGLLPERVGKVPVGELFQRLPDVMVKLHKAAQQGEEVLNEYLSRQEAEAEAKKAAEAQPPMSNVAPS